MVGPIDVKRKGSASVGYWIQYVTLTFDLTHNLDLGCFKVKFRNSSIYCWSDWFEMKTKWVNMILGRLYDLALSPHPWPWPWIWNLKVRVWNSFIWGMGRPIIYIIVTWNEKDVSQLFMTMILTCVTMVAWADVPDSDWGDLRRRRAVDISSSGLNDGDR